MRDYRQTPSFWTYALLSQRKTLIASSMEICQHLSKTRQLLSTLDIITIYRTNNSTEQITRVALVEVTKKKANPATDEVGVENRNHGLAWSQSGNNRTVARLIQKLSPREELRAPVQRLTLSPGKQAAVKIHEQSWLSHIAILHSWCSCPRRDFVQKAKSRGGTLVTRAYIKEST